MKTHRIAITALSAGAALMLLSCNTEDPSAVGEFQRDLAEVMAQNNILEAQVADLTEELAQAQQSGAEAESMKMPTREEIEKSLAIEGTKLQQAARDLHPNSKVESFGTFDLNIPSFENPFSCKAAVKLRVPSGELKTLYWIGNGNMKGEWKFDKTENLQPDLVTNNAGNPQSEIKRPEPEPKRPEPEPERPEPKKPEIEYDIPLKDPVMRPKGR